MSINQQKLEKLQSVLKQIDTDYASSEEVAKITALLVKEIKSIKDNISSLSETFNNEFNQIISDHLALQKKGDYSSTYLMKEIDSLKTALTNLKLKHGVDGRDGSDGRDGRDGAPGKDGSPDSPDQVVDKIHKSSKKIKAEKIEGLDELNSKIEEGKKTLERRITSLPIWQGVSEVRVKELIRDTTTTPGASAFTDLTDTFTSYTGLAGKGLRVNATETGIDTYTPTDTDEKVKLSATDPTAGYLNAKLAAGVDRIVENEYIDFLEQGSSPALPANTTGRMWASDTNGKTNLNFIGSDGITQRIMRDLISTVRNTSGAPIARGKLVFQTGSTGTAPNVALARADSMTTLPAIGITMEAIADNGYGRVQRFGRTEFQLDTTGYAAGDELFVSPTTAGEFTKTRPTHPNMAQAIGTVVVPGVGNGSIFTAFTSYYNGHSDGTIQPTWTFGATTAGSLKLANTSTAQRTATFQNSDGTVAYTSDITSDLHLDQTTPQVVSGGAPTFANGIRVEGNIIDDSSSTIIISYLNRIIYDSNGYKAFEGATRELLAGENVVKFNWATMQFPTLTTNGLLKVSGDNGTIGVDTSTYLTDIVNDTTPQLGGDLDINEKYIKLLAVPTADSTANGEIVSDIVAGATIAFPDLVYLNTSGKWAKVDANAVATCQGMFGIALESKNADEAVKVLLRGFIRYDTWNWASVGLPVYASTTAGGLSQTLVSGEDDVVVMAGTVTHADRIYFNPQTITIEYKA